MSIKKARLGRRALNLNFDKKNQVIATPVAIVNDRIRNRSCLLFDPGIASPAVTVNLICSVAPSDSPTALK